MHAPAEEFAAGDGMNPFEADSNIYVNRTADRLIVTLTVQAGDADVTLTCPNNTEVVVKAGSTTTVTFRVSSDDAVKANNAGKYKFESERSAS